MIFLYDQAIIGSGIDGLVTHIYPATARTAANLVAGTHTITAAYSGDSSYAESTSAVTTVART